MGIVAQVRGDSETETFAGASVDENFCADFRYRDSDPVSPAVPVWLALTARLPGPSCFAR